MQEIIQLSCFYLISVGLFAYIGAQAEWLRDMTLIAIWANLLLAHGMALPSLFQQDETDGVLDQLRLAPCAFETVILAKLCSHWAGAVAPLILVAPIAAFAGGFSSADALGLAASLALGSLCLLAISGVAAALTTQYQQRAALLLLIIMPLYLPVMVFGISALDADKTRADDAWMLLIGLTFFMLPLAFLAMVKLLRK